MKESPGTSQKAVHGSPDTERGNCEADAGDEHGARGASRARAPHRFKRLVYLAVEPKPHSRRVKPPASHSRLLCQAPNCGFAEMSRLLIALDA